MTRRDARAINRTAWPEEERAEYDEMLAEIADFSSDTTERLDQFERLLNDAIQAHKWWATEVERACVRHGMGNEIRRYQDRQRVLVSSQDARVLSVSKIQGRRVRTADGSLVHQRELIELWTWEQIAEKRLEVLKVRRAYDDKVAHYDKLLSLRDLCPDAATPADAAVALGIGLDAYLGAAA